jgi:hypothetical protein
MQALVRIQAYLLADTVVAIPAVDLAIEAVVARVEVCVALHSRLLSSQNTRGCQCTCVPFSNQKVVT